VKPALLEILTCPHDQSSLRLVGATNGADVVEGSLRCERGHEWPVRESVPRMVPDENDQQNTLESFSAKWAGITPDEVRQRYRQQHAWYVERFGFGDEHGLREFLADKQLVLDAGTGTGGDAARFAELAPHSVVVGVDLSGAIDIAQREFGNVPNVHFVQADLMRPPAPPARFDFVSSDQVIHHTPDARRAFATVAGRVRAGGHLAVYVYKVKAPLRELADDWIRTRSTRMSPDECMELARDITELGRELSRAAATVTLERGVPLLGIAPGEHDVQRLIYWSFLKCFWSDDFSDNLNVLVNFDWYHPPYASRHTEDELRGWCDDCGLRITHMDVSDSGLSVLACREA
jgi:SAM-dependent methyltransferase